MPARILETLSLLTLLGVVALRPLVSESYDSAGNPFRESIASIEDPSPVRTLVFDALILAAAGGWLIARARGPTRAYRWTGLEWGAGVVLVAAVVSCFFAGNKRLAVNGAIDWVCYPVLAIALAQLMTTPWHRRLLVAVIVAGGAVQAYQCFEQVTVGFRYTLEQYESGKADFWEKQGVPLDSPQVESFERRLKAHEATGGFPHSNVAGSYLVLCTFAALACTISGLGRRASRDAHLVSVLRLVVAIFLGVGAALTKSLGTRMAGGAGLALWAAVWLGRRWIQGHRRTTLGVAWGCVGLAAAAVVGHGLYHGSLPTWSLTFRWQYWTASAGMIADHPLTGVGRENFGRHYLQYKTIDSPEEVSNPHNLFVQAAADWGIAGAVGVLVMLIGGSVVMTRSRREHTREPPAPSSRSTKALWLLTLLGVVTLARIPLLGTDDPGFVYYTIVTGGLISGLAAAWMAVDPRPVPPADAAVPGSGFSTGLACGLFAFLLHDMINFALFVPASATAFFAALAVCVSERGDPPARSGDAGPWLRWLPVGAVAAAIGVVLWFGVIPVGTATTELRLAERQGVSAPVETIQDQAAYRQLLAAAEADPWDPTPLMRRAAWLLGVAADPNLRVAALNFAAQAARSAVERDPYSMAPQRLLMNVYQLLAHTSGARAAYEAAIKATRRVLELYPQSPAALAELGHRQFEAGEALASPELLAEAAASYRGALELDGKRLGWEELRRFSARDRKDIESRIAEIEHRLNSGGSSPRP